MYCNMYGYVCMPYTGNLSPGVHFFQFINFVLRIPPFFFHSASSQIQIFIFSNVITGTGVNKYSRSFNTAVGRVVLLTRFLMFGKKGWLGAETLIVLTDARFP